MSVHPSLIIQGLPDLIRDAVADIGGKIVPSHSGQSIDSHCQNIVDLSSYVQNAQGATTFVPPKLRDAFASGDYSKIEQINHDGATDMDPIYGNIREHEENSFVQIFNMSNNTPYWISFSGPANAPTGYMWTYTAPSNSGKSMGNTENGDDIRDDPSFTPLVQIGTLSRNTKFLGISNSSWDNKALSVTASVISTIATYVLTKFIKSRIAGTAFATAMEGAIAQAGEQLVARGLVTAAAWQAGVLSTASVVGGAIAGTVLVFLIMFIADFVMRDYKCCINVYNWTDKPYQVSAYFGSNEKIDDDQEFKIGALPPVTGKSDHADAV